MQMTVISGPYEILPPEKGPAGRPSFRIATHEGEWFASKKSTKRRAGFAHILALLAAGGAAVVIVGWQTSHGHAARETIASLSPNLSWVAPEQTDRIEQISRRVDQMASNMAANHEQLTRSIDKFASGQEQMAHRVDKFASGHDELTHRVDRFASAHEELNHRIDQLAAGQEQMTHRIDQLATGQEQMSRKISRLRASGQPTADRLPGGRRDYDYHHR